jgi:hypothetical protein
MPVLARLPVARPRCRMTSVPVARWCRPLLGDPVARFSDSSWTVIRLPVSRSWRHPADPVARAVVVTSAEPLAEFAVGVLARPWPGTSKPVAPGKPVARCFEARSSARRAGEPALVASELWLLAPTGPALVSWAGHVFRRDQPEGFTRKTRSLGPGRRAGGSMLGSPSASHS